MEWRRDQIGGANKLPPLQKKQECSRFNNPPSVVTIRPRQLLIRVKCSSGCRHQSLKRPTSVKDVVYPNTFYCFLFICPPPHHQYHSLSPLLSYAAIILSHQGVDVKAAWCVCADSRGPGSAACQPQFDGFQTTRMALFSPVFTVTVVEINYSS